MNLICKLFGHKPWVYRKLLPSGYDGIGRHHGMLMARCHRCDMRYHEGNVHIPDDEIIKFAQRAQAQKEQSNGK